MFLRAALKLVRFVALALLCTVNGFAQMPNPWNFGRHFATGRPMRQGGVRGSAIAHPLLAL
jgi:hypothetical protein